MTDPGREAAILAVAAILTNTPGDMDARTWAVACVNAAEAVWPHDPPKRSPETTTSGQFTIRNQPTRPIGFSNWLLGQVDSEEPHA